MVINRHYGFEKFYDDMLHASTLGRLKKVNLSLYDNIVFLGIGGSEIPGEVIKCLNLKLPVITANEDLPNFVNNKTLCFIVSYSGNTAETLKLYKSAKKRKANIIIITSGGKLSKLDEVKVLIPSGYLPREGVLFLLFPILNILNINYKETFKVIKKADKNNIKKTAKLLASEMNHKIPIIYVSHENLKCIAKRFVRNLNENSKVFAHSNYFPEISHNEILANFDSRFYRLLLYDNITKITKKASNILNITKSIKLSGKSTIAKILYGFYLSALTSFYLAEVRGFDYREMDNINILKGIKKKK